MKKKLLKSNDKASARVQEIQTVVLIALVVALVVMSAVVAVLMGQLSSHEKSLDRIYDTIQVNR